MQNKHVRGSVKVAKKIMKKTLKLFRHVMIKEDRCVGKVC